MKKVVIGVVVAVLLCLGAAGGVWWWGQKQAAAVAEPAEVSGPSLDPRHASYVSLDKIVVMLKTDLGERMGNSYMSLDLVLRTDKSHEKALKGELPMLKGVAVRTLSQVELTQARGMSIDQWTELLSADLVAAYASHPDLRLFDKVMVSRLIIE
jgi:flagellar FliL protein